MAAQVQTPKATGLAVRATAVRPYMAEAAATEDSEWNAMHWSVMMIFVRTSNFDEDSMNCDGQRTNAADSNHKQRDGETEIPKETIITSKIKHEQKIK